MKKFLAGIFIGIALSMFVVDVSLWLAKNDRDACLSSVAPEVWTGCYAYQQSSVFKRIINAVNPSSIVMDEAAVLQFALVRLLLAMPVQNRGGSEI